MLVLLVNRFVTNVTKIEKIACFGEHIIRGNVNLALKQVAQVDLLLAILLDLSLLYIVSQHFHLETSCDLRAERYPIRKHKSLIRTSSLSAGLLAHSMRITDEFTITHLIYKKKKKKMKGWSSFRHESILKEN